MKSDKKNNSSKINLFLSVGKKIKGSHLHNIQSLVILINIYES